MASRHLILGRSNGVLGTSPLLTLKQNFFEFLMLMTIFFLFQAFFVSNRKKPRFKKYVVLEGGKKVAVAQNFNLGQKIDQTFQNKHFIENTERKILTSEVNECKYLKDHSSLA